MLQKLSPFCFFTILLLGLVFRLDNFEKSMWWDEFVTFKRMMADDFWLEWHREYRSGLYNLVAKIWVNIFGLTVFNLRFLSLVLGMGSLVAFMLWLNKYSCLSALLGGLLILTSSTGSTMPFPKK